MKYLDIINHYSCFAWIQIIEINSSSALHQMLLGAFHSVSSKALVAATQSISKKVKVLNN